MYQLTFCRLSSTCVNYQAKWVTYRTWCRTQGHSISRPSVSKIADFHLYLCCSLHLSYSSIASYRSMLSAVFCFVLPEISSPPILHDLLHSFRIERPLPSSRVPPWDLLRVLTLLQGSPFEPLSSCSLRDLSRKVLFLVSLATARQVCELHAVSSSVSFLSGDIFPLTSLGSGPSLNPLRILCLGILESVALRDFVGDLPCPVRALQIYLNRTSSLSPRPWSICLPLLSFSSPFQECFKLLSS